MSGRLTVMRRGAEVLQRSRTSSPLPLSLSHPPLFLSLTLLSFSTHLLYYFPANMSQTVLFICLFICLVVGGGEETIYFFKLFYLNNIFLIGYLFMPVKMNIIELKKKTFLLCKLFVTLLFFTLSCCIGSEDLI